MKKLHATAGHRQQQMDRIVEGLKGARAIRDDLRQKNAGRGAEDAPSPPPVAAADAPPPLSAAAFTRSASR